jgi:hypothetical protein
MMRKFIFINFILMIHSFLSANIADISVDPLVKGEKYFQKALEKSKENDFGRGRVIAVLDMGINNNIIKGALL